jgi:hypothetical protein
VSRGTRLVLILGLGLWLIGLALGRDATDQPWLTEAAWIGDALSPLGAVATLAALLHAFDAQAQTGREKHRDALAAAYAGWLREARAILSDLEVKTTAHIWNLRGTEKFENAVYRNQNEMRHLLQRLRRELAISRTEILVFEDDPGMVSRIEMLTTTLGRYPADDNLAELEAREKDVKKLGSDLEEIATLALKRVRGDSVTAKAA